jgi:hypothetical protein
MSHLGYLTSVIYPIIFDKPKAVHEIIYFLGFAETLICVKEGISFYNALFFLSGQTLRSGESFGGESMPVGIAGLGHDAQSLSDPCPSKNKPNQISLRYSLFKA